MDSEQERLLFDAQVDAWEQQIASALPARGGGGGRAAVQSGPIIRYRGDSSTS